MNSKHRSLAALCGEPVDRVPVFPLIMFLAAYRLRVSYRDYATNGRVMAEAQLKLCETFGVDAITACSDAFRISADLGGEMIYPENRTPYLARPLVRSESDFNWLKKPHSTNPQSRMADRTNAVREKETSIR